MQLTHRITNFSLPLLAKELIEQGARRRTYIVRSCYAVLLFFACWLFFYQTLQIGMVSPLAALGRGRDMYMVIVFLQFAGVYLFMPAITCGVLTQEKERDSLQLLFLTRLGPWTILLEKLMSRVLPMLGFLLLSLPLLAFAYSLGGISQRYLWTGIGLLVLATIQTGTIALACSSYFPTTVSAFVATYIILAILFFGPGIGWMVLHVLGFDIEQFIRGMVGGALGPSVLSVLFFPFFSPAYFALVSFPGGIGIWNVLVHSAVSLGTTGLFLGIARNYVVRNGQRQVRIRPNGRFAVLRAPTLPSFRNPAADAPIPPTNPADLPNDTPVAWRESRRHWLGRTSNLFLLALCLEMGLAAFCFVLVLINNRGTEVFLGMFVFLMWGVAALVVSAQGAGLIAGERARQTLDVLCTTPLTGREIVAQKMRAVHRLIVALWLPFFSIALFGSVWKSLPHVQMNRSSTAHFDDVLYLACSCLAPLIYLPLVAWLSLLVGLAVRSQTRAIIGSMAAVVAWCAIPPVFIGLPLSIAYGPFSNSKTSDHFLLLLSSPATILFCNEFGLLEHYMEAPWAGVIINFTGYALALVIVRAVCLDRADHWLGRGFEGKSRSPPSHVPLAETPAVAPVVPAGLPGAN